ncbi:MAG TPA: hypothetical protein EYO33_21650 [Phycisphaerales bacterium]|nr:hypothetical protein [Phycisphaerales bacterium]
MGLSHFCSRKTSGLSMIEVLIAIFVVSMGVLGTISSLWYGIKSERHSERRTQAIYQARELLNLIRARNEPFNNNHLDLGSNLNDGNYDDDSDDGRVRRAFNAAPFASDLSDEFNFQRSVEMKILDTNASSHRSRMVAIKVMLFWTEGDQEKMVTLWTYHRRP